MNGIMAEPVTKIDKAGRVVIPKEVRQQMGLVGGTNLLLVADVDKGIIIIKKLDVERMARELKQDVQKAAKGHKTLVLSKRPNTSQPSFELIKKQ